MDGTEWLKALDLKRWWLVAIAVGVVTTLAAIVAQNQGAIIVGFGIISCGFGEWMNHRMEMEIRHGGTLTTYERVNRSLGLALDGLGFVLLALGFYRLFTT